VSFRDEVLNGRGQKKKLVTIDSSKFAHGRPPRLNLSLKDPTLKVFFLLTDIAIFGQPVDI
jgi:hypothetical protein